MSELFDEVDEDVRRDQLKRLWDRYSIYIVAGALLIIVGHVKDGIELAKEYNLPTSVHAFIQQHHGTTLVEYFYRRAEKERQNNPDAVVEEGAFRYPGPKPQTHSYR